MKRRITVYFLMVALIMSIFQLTTLPTEASTSTSSTEYVIYTNHNIAAVQSGPTRKTTFTIQVPHVITNIQNYHYFNNGILPGTIALLSEDGVLYGPWQAVGSSGQGGVANAYWDVFPEVSIPAGTYTIIDSDTATWSQNSSSNNKGLTIVRGYTVAQGDSAGSDLPSLTFPDLPSNHWAYPYVQIMVDLGIISGYPDGTFGPNDTFCRAAFAKLLALSFELEPYTGNEVPYTDLPSTHWAYGHVMSAQQFLTYFQKSDGSKVYLPNDKAVREDVAVAMLKVIGLDPNEAKLSLLDAYADAGEVSSNLRKHVALAIEYGIMKGSDDKFYPQKALTRAEACTLFARYLTEIKPVLEEDDLIKKTGDEFNENINEAGWYFLESRYIKSESDNVEGVGYFMCGAKSFDLTVSDGKKNDMTIRKTRKNEDKTKTLAASTWNVKWDDPKPFYASGSVVEMKLSHRTTYSKGWSGDTASVRVLYFDENKPLGTRTYTNFSEYLADENGKKQLREGDFILKQTGSLKFMENKIMVIAVRAGSGYDYYYYYEWRE